MKNWPSPHWFIKKIVELLINIEDETSQEKFGQGKRALDL